MLIVELLVGPETEEDERRGEELHEAVGHPDLRSRVEANLETVSAAQIDLFRIIARFCLLILQTVRRELWLREVVVA